ncbi:ATP-dependent helicase HrpB [Desulfovibrio subterraneus]|uniref:ATP-dependent helicase HrpB n=1 Tax=Desulfovibrio subterraneus TaxID=2718620 RepID=UPI0022B86E6F|nr:ATP-dependent helicase HrpB [Desulfovibrio subterraneus]WBF67296.1 ATP-dependent helicase HrpB [Desulfovibrio subterraneus]
MHILPIDTILTDLLTSLEHTPNALLHAPPGAGKTTRVPLALLSAGWLGERRVLMLEPRRIAARAAAGFMARALGEEVGRTVGYRIRHETRVSAATRIEVVTEGVLTRLLQADPELSGYGIIIFDEFHERSIHADLGLALCTESQAALRDNLRLLVMSATLDCAPVASLLGRDGTPCPVISSEGRSYPVEVRHVPPPRRHMQSSGVHLDDAHAASVIRHALANDTGSILVFLPGAGEIRRIAAMLESTTLPENVSVHPLYGDLSASEQDAAIAPAPAGTRKVVLATSIAETSLTIEGVRVVVDCGLSRLPRFDPGSGMTRLVTERVSLAAATQRQGRAGRLEPGTCYRLWDAAEEHSMRSFAAPEIAEADLAPLVLELAAWGIAGYEGALALPWLTPPPQGNYQQACTLLRDLGALDEALHITPHGSELLSLPLHPRLGHMVLTAARSGEGGTACVVAALLSDRDSRQTGADMRHRVAECAGLTQPRSDQSQSGTPERAMSGGRNRMADTVQHIMRTVRHAIPDAAFRRADPEAAGECLALAYPDRIAQQRGNGTFRLSGGKTAYLPPEDPLARESFLAVGELDGNAARARIWRAAPVGSDLLEELFADRVTQGSFVVWDSRTEAVAARSQKRLGALILADAPLADAGSADVTEVVVEGIRSIGLHCLPWTAEATALRARIQFLSSVDIAACATGGEATSAESVWPDLSDTALLDTLPQWLGPFLSGITRRSQFKSLDLCAAITALLDWPMLQRLDRDAPTHLEVPSGSRIRLDYTEQGGPTLPVKLQEMFGAKETPAIAGGRFPLLVHLLSPAGRPLQVTRDLVSFWKNGYPAVRAEMRGRYPRHPWPEDPTTAQPTRHVTKRMQQG